MCNTFSVVSLGLSSTIQDVQLCPTLAWGREPTTEPVVAVIQSAMTPSPTTAKLLPSSSYHTAIGPLVTSNKMYHIIDALKMSRKLRWVRGHDVWIEGQELETCMEIRNKNITILDFQLCFTFIKVGL